MKQFGKQQAGFTLVEIAIVLVIIGLLLGGILKGQEMITQAKIKNLINDLNGITAAMNSYQDRYRALPGDDKNASTRWVNTTSSGNGDGVLQDPYLSTVPGTLTAQTGPESVFFWHHLRLSGFVSGTGADHPFNAVSGKMGVQTGAGLSTSAAPTTAPGATLTGFGGLILCSGNLPDKVAISIDAQLDDANGATGSVRAATQSGLPPTLDAGAGAAATNYVETGTNIYTLCRQL
ncbi:MAG: hypothetical protein A2V78_08835 [Betaproteobacteria bacterium RBG_16_64_18]|nr:MAG: hypothetical protein A2V78_08835 [Betaproteobacteria bacterium RBG_16_64_18]